MSEGTNEVTCENTAKLRIVNCCKLSPDNQTLYRSDAQFSFFPVDTHGTDHSHMLDRPPKHSSCNLLSCSRERPLTASESQVPGAEDRSCRLVARVLPVPSPPALARYSPVQTLHDYLSDSALSVTFALPGSICPLELNHLPCPHQCGPLLIPSIPCHQRSFPRAPMWEPCFILILFYWARGW